MAVPSLGLIRGHSICLLLESFKMLDCKRMDFCLADLVNVNLCYVTRTSEDHLFLQALRVLFSGKEELGRPS